MNPTEVLKLNEQVIDAWNKHNGEKFIELCDENVVWKINGGMETYRGKREVKDYFDRWFTAFPDLNLKIRTKTATEDSVTTEYEFSGTQKGKFSLKKEIPEIPPKQKPVHTFGCYITKIKNGKVAETNLYVDRLTMVEQLGIERELIK